MKILSLFNGISCARVALQKAGINVERYVSFEIDKYANAISKYNYPDDEYYEDVSFADFSAFKGFDLVIGGSPCTDLSIAKKDRQGLAGEKSSLFWHLARAIKEVKPKYFLVENVASMTKENEEKISKKLGVEPILINSALVSAQTRKRLYWTNIPNIELPPDREIIVKDILEEGISCMDGELGTFNSMYLKEIETDNVVKKTVPIRIGKIGKGGQGERVYDVIGKSVCLLANGGGRGGKTGLYRIDFPDGSYGIRKLSPLESERLQTLPDNYTNFGNLRDKISKISNNQRYITLGNGFTVDIIAHMLKEIKY